MAFRITGSTKLYAIEIDLENEEHWDEVKAFAEQCETVIIVDEIYDLQRLGINPDTVELVERDEEE